MALYNKTVLDHFKNPRNVGTIENADGIGEIGNQTCGDIVKVYLKIKGDMIEDVKFETYGCVTAIASSSIATELIKGKSICNALLLTNEDIIEALDGLPEEKKECSVLIDQAIKLALDDYYSKEPEKYTDETQCYSHNCHCCCKSGGCHNVN